MWRFCSIKHTKLPSKSKKNCADEGEQEKETQCSYSAWTSEVQVSIHNEYAQISNK